MDGVVVGARGHIGGHTKRDPGGKTLRAPSRRLLVQIGGLQSPKSNNLTFEVDLV